jgi:hypothetical protein
VSFSVEGDYFEVCNCDVSCYHGHWSADFSGTNSFVTDFRYEG